MKIGRQRVEAFYKATAEYYSSMEKELTAKGRYKRALKKQTKQAAELWFEISDAIYRTSEHELRNLFFELIRLDCSLEMVVKVLEAMGYMEVTQ